MTDPALVSNALDDRGLEPTGNGQRGVTAACPRCRGPELRIGFIPAFSVEHSCGITAAELLSLLEIPSEDVSGSSDGHSPLIAALKASRVDLLARIRDGIPPREFVPGAPMLARSSINHVAAPTKAGKSLTLAVVLAAAVIEAGGSVIVLDRENGEDEYARRLADLLTARDPRLPDAIAARYEYHAWPRILSAFGADPAYGAALDADVVIFDSVRRFLTLDGLKEDSADEYGVWFDALAAPLKRAGRSVILLDNTGHENKSRSRGTAAKLDLADVIFSMSEISKFDRQRTGSVLLRVEESRFGEIAEGDAWKLELGGGTFGTWATAGQVEAAPTRERDRGAAIDQAILAAIENDHPISQSKLARDLRKGKGTVSQALDRLEAGNRVRRTPNGYEPVPAGRTGPGPAIESPTPANPEVGVGPAADLPLKGGAVGTALPTAALSDVDDYASNLMKGAS